MHTCRIIGNEKNKNTIFEKYGTSADFAGPRDAKFFFPKSSDRVIIWFGRLGLRVRVRVNFVVMVRVSKLLGLNFDPNPNCNFALTLIMTLNSP